MHHYQWDQVEKEQMNESLARQAIHSATMTVARVYLVEGAVVPEHQHVSEQISMVERGRLRFLIEDKEVEVGAGETLVMESNLPHAVKALEDSIVVDLFSPARTDWQTGDDAYLRSK